MPRYAMSFFSDAQGNRAHLIDADSREEALRLFFEQYAAEYTKNSEGFAYFREDFEDAERPMGTMLELPS